ncbi:ABC transporter substrate-binding protein [Methylobacterium platani]|uniref:ABC transporter substrate-binding protein n=2 Tax=Methylobacterium platani TaxID=427683 RepID=A0A179S2S5_9HYPH|nr:ABC transporter substrate-binding protein [Methylobacterium platani]KMO13948.1 ABC transporter substrate-binding protein [Methylobacterium platani JCM 14648]OAS20069.1 ABC transporter substrate-binding protein [Methylobacterium platani]
MRPDRRSLLIGSAALALAGPAHAAEPLRDDAGRALDGVKRPVARVFPAGPPAAILLYTLAPDLLLGWPRAIRPAEKPYLLPQAADLPEVGRLTGRGNTANLEAVLALKPDLILDIGSTAETYRSLADRVQDQTGIPTALLDGRLASTPATYRRLGRLLGREAAAEPLAALAEGILATMRERVAAVPPEKRPRVYLARGPRGLETARAGAINVEALALMGAVDVAGPGGGLAQVSPEDVVTWAPEVIVALDPAFAAAARQDPLWQATPALARNRLYVSPSLPFGWVDFPPSVNRLVGLWWLGRILYPAQFPEDIRAIARDLYGRLYHVTPDDPALDRVLAGAL